MSDAAPAANAATSCRRLGDRGRAPGAGGGPVPVGTAGTPWRPPPRAVRPAAAVSLQRSERLPCRTSTPARRYLAHSCLRLLCGQIVFPPPAPCTRVARPAVRARGTRRRSAQAQRSFSLPCAHMIRAAALLAAVRALAVRAPRPLAPPPRGRRRRRRLPCVRSPAHAAALLALRRLAVLAERVAAALLAAVPPPVLGTACRPGYGRPPRVSAASSRCLNAQAKAGTLSSSSAVAGACAAARAPHARARAHACSAAGTPRSCLVPRSKAKLREPRAAPPPPPRSSRRRRSSEVGPRERLARSSSTSSTRRARRGARGDRDGAARRVPALSTCSSFRAERSSLRVPFRSVRPSAAPSRGELSPVGNVRDCPNCVARWWNSRSMLAVRVPRAR